MVVEDDLHAGWETLLPLWRAKEPVIDSFVKKRFGIPLFFERSIIQITPAAGPRLGGRRHHRRPAGLRAGGAGLMSNARTSPTPSPVPAATPTRSCPSSTPTATRTASPASSAADPEHGFPRDRPARRRESCRRPAPRSASRSATSAPRPASATTSAATSTSGARRPSTATGSAVTRRHGRPAGTRPTSRSSSTPSAASPSRTSYMEDVGGQHRTSRSGGRSSSRPACRSSPPRSCRSRSVARSPRSDDDFTWGWWLLALVAGCAVHLGLNMANDIFDDASGADAANVTPTPFSGGSRVIQYGLVSRQRDDRASCVALLRGRDRHRRVPRRGTGLVAARRSAPSASC